MSVPKPAVRIESDTSIGRSYGKKLCMEKGLGERRAALKDKTFSADWGEDTPTIMSHTLAKVHLRRATRADVLEYFHNTWDLTDQLFSSLRDDSVFYSIPDKLRRPLMFYFAHPAALYINKLHFAGLLDHVNPHYEVMFETGVDEMSWDDMDDMQDVDFPWPTIAEAQAFRLECKARVVHLIKTMKPPCEAEVTMDNPLWALFMGFEHERIHIETSSVLIHQLAVGDVQRPLKWKYAPTNAPTPDKAPKNELLPVKAGRVVLGKPRDFPSFGFDNEYGTRAVDVPAFRASKFLVTNAEFLPFVLAKGYEQKQFWVSPTGDDEGWRWVEFRNAKHPSWWVATKDQPDFIGGKPGYPYQKDDGADAAGSGGQFKLRVMFDIIDMPWDWPVEVNYHEARAFLNWKQAQDGVEYRLPTEAEHHMYRALPSMDPEDEFYYKKLPAGSYDEKDIDALVDPIMKEEAPGNTNLRFGSSSPVDMFPPTPAGFYDVSGNVWEWVEDHFAPLPEFQFHYLYDDFSTPCFDGWHTMMMGGCWVSTGDQSSAFARYAFRRHFFQHLGFRYVALEPSRKELYPGAGTVKNIWEGIGDLSTDVTNSFASKAIRLPYAPALLDMESALEYNTKLADHCAVLARDHVPGAANVLHVGCGVGGLAFALAKHFKSVAAIDKDEVLVRHARVLQHHGQLEYEIIKEGVVTETNLVHVDKSVDRSRITFHLGDVTSPHADVDEAGPFDLVVMDGLLTRLVQPLDLLKRLAGMIKSGGLLVVASDNDWTPDHTPRNGWLGGFKMNGEDMDTLTMLRHTLKKSFELRTPKVDLTKIRRRHARRYDVSIMEVTAWQRSVEGSRNGTGGAAGAGAGAAACAGAGAGASTTDA